MLVQMAEDFAYRYADVVISMLPKAKGYMVAHGMDPAKFHYVPNGIDADEWERTVALPVAVKESLERIRQKGLPIVAYAGTHGLANALDALLDIGKLVQGHIEIVLVGSGLERDRLLRRVEAEQIDNVTMLPAIPKAAIPNFLKSVDIAYIGWHKNPMYRFGISPNKLMDYMFASKPIIHVVEAGNDPVAEAGCGFTVAPGDSVAIYEAMLKLAGLTAAERETLGSKGRALILHSQTYSVLAKQFLEAMHETRN